MPCSSTMAGARSSPAARYVMTRLSPIVGRFTSACSTAGNEDSSRWLSVSVMIEVWPIYQSL